MKASLHRRLLYSYILLTVVVLVSVSLAISVLLREYFISSKSKELINKGYEIGFIVDNYRHGRIDQVQFESFINSIDSILGARVWVVDGSRNIVAISTPRANTERSGRLKSGKGQAGLRDRISKELDQVFAGEVIIRDYHHPVYEEDMLIVGVPLVNDEGFVESAVILHAPVRGIDEFLKQLYYSIGGIGLLALALAVLVVRWLTSGIVRPLKAMQISAAAMAHGDYNARIAITTDDELGALGNSLNTLACELERFVSNTIRMEKLRRDFIANVSHELRTPLTIIRGYTEALLDGTLETQQAEKYYRLMRDETVRLEKLIRELLDLSKIQAQSHPMDEEAIPLTEVVDGVVQMMGNMANKKGVSIRWEAAAGENSIRANGDRLTQLLLILIDNAVKFTPDGGRVSMRVWRERDKVVLEVADTGKGISEEDLPFIWERFYKADKSHSRLEAGSGLGLAIAKEIIDRHNAVVSVESTVGEGTVFRIVFPAVKGTPEVLVNVEY
ncbi:MAG: integral rane sensor signal transduction histidine kinase [Firmicutes bacterium]|nr:integral rane sensor signal transduction histidine kinase [Bacillota bacterium]